MLLPSTELDYSLFIAFSFDYGITFLKFIYIVNIG